MTLRFHCPMTDAEFAEKAQPRQKADALPEVEQLRALTYRLRRQFGVDVVFAQRQDGRFQVSAPPGCWLSEAHDAVHQQGMSVEELRAYVLGVWQGAFVKHYAPPRPDGADQTSYAVGK